MGALFDHAKAEGRTMDAAKCAKFDTLELEASTLNAQIQAAKGNRARQEKLATFRQAMNGPRPRTWTPDTPDAAGVLESAGERRQRELSSAFGDYSLHAFKGEQGRTLAYDAGIMMLASGNSRCREWAETRCRERGLPKLAPFQGEDSNIGGGYLVFPEFEKQLIILRELYGVLRRTARKIPMNSDLLLWPRRTAGTTVYYPGENSQLTMSQEQFDQIQLVARKYAQMSLWSTELGEDSVISMADTLADEFAYQFSRAEDFNGFVGDGTSSYGGVTGLLPKLALAANAGSLNTATGHSTVAATTMADWEGTVGALPLYAEARARWNMHKTVFWAGPARLIDAVGGNLAMLLITGAQSRSAGWAIRSS